LDTVILEESAEAGVHCGKLAHSQKRSVLAARVSLRDQASIAVMVEYLHDMSQFKTAHPEQHQSLPQRFGPARRSSALTLLDCLLHLRIRWQRTTQSESEAGTLELC
jgi:hypothetical protein